MTIQEVIDVLVAEGFEYVGSWASESHRMHQIIGEDYLSARMRGSGVSIEYTTHDVRRAVAHLRLRDTVGISSSYQMNNIHGEIKNIAMHHNTGSVVHDGHTVTWEMGSGLTDTINDLLMAGSGFIVIPCHVESFDNYATVALQTEEA